MYAVDLMLDWRQDANNNSKTIEPVICEMNFMPGNISYKINYLFNPNNRKKISRFIS